MVPLLVLGLSWAARPPGEIAFVDDRSCAGCHQREYRAWSGSHHARAMQEATAGTVSGDFGEARLTLFGVTTRFFRRAGRFMVNTEGPDGRAADFEIRYTFGVEPLQQYLVELPGGRLQALTIAWDTRGRRWFPLYPEGRIPPGDPLHWTGRYQNWNLMCAECHTTNLAKGYDPRTDTYRTTWSAIDVGCQACHGPGAAHLAWARAPRPARAEGDGRMGLLVVRSADWRQEVDACGRCHSRRTALDGVERPGHPLLDGFRPAWLRPGLYHPDGQQLGEVYEYGSFLQSRMYQVGVRCTACHDPHRAEKSPDDTVCTRCHRKAGDPRFPMLRVKTYDAPSHHFHPKPGSAGARCVACHMPARTYMTVDPRRDHSIRIPRPDLTLTLGTPNACNDCHRDRSPEWAVAALRKWYGPERRAPHYGEAIAAGWARQRAAGPGLAVLAGAGAEPAIVRATALDLLRDHETVGREALVAATRDADPLIRVAAAGALDRAPPEVRVAAVAPLLGDPIRAVRIEAARALAGVPPDHLDPAQREGLRAALGELVAAQRAMADLPVSYLSLASVQARLGRPDLAEQSYLTALRMDPRLSPARLDLATLYSGMGRNADAESILRQGLTLTPAAGELSYALGLLLAEEQRFAEAAGALGEAARLLPGQARVHYNHGLVLQALGRRPEAEAALLRALALDGDDPRTAHALAVFHAQQRDYRRSLEYAELASRLAPDDAGARRLVDRLRQAVAGHE